LERWQLPIAHKHNPHGENGIIFGTGILGVDSVQGGYSLIDARIRADWKLTSVMQTMASGITLFGGIS